MVIGSGPNGLAAAIALAQVGWSVLVREAAPTVGGGARSAALTLPGFVHDICSAIHPLAVASPFLRTLPLEAHGLEWIYPPAALAHPFDDGSVALLERSIEATATTLGVDGAAYKALLGPLVADWEKLAPNVLAPLRLPKHPLPLARFGSLGLRSAAGLARCRFRGEQAQGFFAGMAAHAILPLERSPSAAAGLLLAMLGHVVGWPLPRGGSQQVAEALASYLRSLGGEIVTNSPVESLAEVSYIRTVLCDVGPRQLLHLAGDSLPAGYRRQLARYRYGPGAFKVDWALDGPIPWKSPACARAATVHLGGSLLEIAASERQVWQGILPEQPYVLLAQQSLFDPTRAPQGKHTGWAYCHVPVGSTADMTDRIEAQIERFAPGFRARILARHVFSPRDFEAHNANYIGGDINGGVQDLWQLYTRPVFRLTPYATPLRGLFLCSASTPPGGGVHGMCGYFAARAALRSAKRR